MRSIVALALLVVLAGCSAQQSPPAASTKPVSSAPHVFSATGPSQQTITVPVGAESAEISVTCGSSTDAHITVAVGTQEQPRNTRCPSTLRFRTATGGTLILNVDLTGGSGRYVGQVRFSAEPFATDPAVARQCTGVSGAFSDIASAQNGYPNGPLDLAGWRGLIASAGKKLTAVSKSGALGTQLDALTAWYGRSNPTPAEGTSSSANEAFEIVNGLCLDNGTPLAILSQYGG